MDSCFFHIDVNSAFLSWTAVDRLLHGDTVDLRTVPSIIGGDRESRHGIVLAKSIPAKKYHIETAEPIVNALKKCPTLIIAGPDMNLYKEMSHRLMDYLYTLTCDIEKASIDECYLDFAPIAHLYESPIKAADMIRSEVFKRFGFTVNVGISDVKVLAKMASDFQKPDKTHTLYSNEIREKMWPLPVGDLFLCGKSAQATLKKLGINTIGELATTDVNILNINMKGIGRTLWEFANGIDNSKVIIYSPDAKGIGNSTTVAENISDRNEASKVIMKLCESVSSRLVKGNLSAGRITVEIKYASFKSVSHQAATNTPIYTAAALHAAAMPLFDELWNHEPIRLLGVRATKLLDINEPVQMNLFDMDFQSAGKETVNTTNAPFKDTEKDKKLEEALRSIKSRFGKDSVKRGSDL